MCIVCRELETKIKCAEAAEDHEKARVMTTILTNHRKHQHPRHNVVAVAPEYIVWPDGQRWEVRT